MPTIDLAALAGVSVTVFLLLCVAVLIAMRDTRYAPPHAVWHWVWCPRHGRAVTVEFSEEMHTGLVTRTVKTCPLRHPGERCGEGCRWEPSRSP